jgi:predicted RNase H-like nuclease (RuvC/YqgF family)
MMSYGYYPMYEPQPYQQNLDPYTHVQFDPYRQPPQSHELERRVNFLEKQLEIQAREITRLDRENNRQNREFDRLNQEIKRINQEIRRIKR